MEATRPELDLAQVSDALSQRSPTKHTSKPTRAKVNGRSATPKQHSSAGDEQSHANEQNDVWQRQVFELLC